jgi:Mn-dependent DtxR family transcriptional regulator
MFDNLNYYRVFYTVANTGNISKAADMLFISQPAISKAISKLEDGLHVKLFLRSSKGVTLTDEGQVLYNHIEKAFSNISQGEDEIRHIHELGIGQLKIGVSTSLCKHILLDKLQTFILENPHIKVIIDCHSTVNTLKLLNDGRIDIGLICKTDIPAGFEYQDVSTIHDIFVVNETYLSNLHLREQEEFAQEPTNPWLFAGNLTGIMGNLDEDVPALSPIAPVSAADKSCDKCENGNRDVAYTNNRIHTLQARKITIYPISVLTINSACKKLESIPQSNKSGNKQLEINYEMKPFHSKLFLWLLWCLIVHTLLVIHVLLWCLIVHSLLVIHVLLWCLIVHSLLVVHVLLWCLIVCLCACTGISSTDWTGQLSVRNLIATIITNSHIFYPPR